MSRITYLAHPLMVFGLVLAALLWGDGATPQRLQAGLFTGVWAHILVSFYMGRFDRLRTLTYLLLVLAMLAGQFFAFARFVLPWGQMAFWLASVLPQQLGSWLAFALEGRMDFQSVWPLVLLALLVIDVMVMQRKAATISRIVAVAMAGLAIVIALRGTTNAALVGALELDQFAVIPHWSLRPGYSILRSAPGKALGVAALAAACAAPLVVPWIPAERFRLSRYGWLWLLNCVALAATCMALGYLGGMPPDDGIIRQSQFATVAYFVFFLGIPLLMKRFVNRMSKHPA